MSSERLSRIASAAAVCAAVWAITLDLRGPYSLGGELGRAHAGVLLVAIAVLGALGLRREPRRLTFAAAFGWVAVFGRAALVEGSFAAMLAPAALLFVAAWIGRNALGPSPATVNSRRAARRDVWRASGWSLLVLAVGSLWARAAWFLSATDDERMTSAFAEVWGRADPSELALLLPRAARERRTPELVALRADSAPVARIDSVGWQDDWSSVDPPDNVLLVSATLADDSTLLTSWTGGGCPYWSLSGIRRYSHGLQPVLDTFLDAWRSGDRERLIALTAKASRPEVADLLPAHGAGGDITGFRPLLGRGTQCTVLSDTRVRADLWGPEGGIWTVWSLHPESGWRLAEIHWK